jgi:adenylate cyclase
MLTKYLDQLDVKAARKWQLTVLTFWLCCASFSVLGQQGRMSDSLKHLLIKCDDSTKIGILVRLSELVPCKDSNQKLAYLLQAREATHHADSNSKRLGVDLRIASYWLNCRKNTGVAQKWYRGSLASACLNRDTLHMINAFCGLGQVYITELNYRLAVLTFDSCLKLQPELATEIAIYGNLGIIYKAIGDFQQAAYYYTLSYDKLLKDMSNNSTGAVGDTIQLAALLMERGSVEKEIGDYERSLASLSNAAALAKNNEYVTALIEMTTGAVHQAKGDYRASIKCFNDAYVHYEQEGDQANMLRALKLMAETQLLTGNQKAAKEYGQVCQRLMEKLPQNRTPAVYLLLAKINAQEGNKAEAEAYVKKAETIINAPDYQEHTKEDWANISYVYERLGRTAEAFAAYKRYVAIKDSAMSISKANAITKISLASEFNRKQVADSLVQATTYEAKISRQRVVLWSGYIGLALVLMLAFVILRSYNQQKKTNRVINIKNEKILIEQRESERLLLNILPEHVATELKKTGSVEAKLFDNVTVLFTDFVNFTNSSEQFTPQQLVNELHHCFKAFDEIMDRHGVEKIKTVGDAYLAVAGLPVGDARHAHKVLAAALEIREFITKRKEQQQDGAFHIRIGVHSGTVIAGIVGMRKFAYDIWGDTVNTAARMEQSSEKDQINISEATYQLIKDEFEVIPRGLVAAKNKGQMLMYFVKGAK